MQRWLAKASGVNYVTINRVLGGATVGKDTARKIANALHCTRVDNDLLLRSANVLPKDIEDELLKNPTLFSAIRKR